MGAERLSQAASAKVSDDIETMLAGGIGEVLANATTRIRTLNGTISSNPDVSSTNQGRPATDAESKAVAQSLQATYDRLQEDYRTANDEVEYWVARRDDLAIAIAGIEAAIMKIENPLALEVVMSNADPASPHKVTKKSTSTTSSV